MKSMLLITSSWGKNKTFKLIPVSEECVYNEAIFDPENRMLAVISKERKDSMHMLAKLNEWGDPVTMKIGKRSNGKEYAEERKTLETFYEYYVEELSEIKNFVELFAINYADFDIAKYLEAPAVQQPTSPSSSIITV